MFDYRRQAKKKKERGEKKVKKSSRLGHSLYTIYCRVVFNALCPNIFLIPCFYRKGRGRKARKIAQIVELIKPIHAAFQILHLHFCDCFGNSYLN